MSKKVVIAGACRTAIGKMGGALSTTPAPVLGSIVIKEALNRAGVPADQDQRRWRPDRNRPCGRGRFSGVSGQQPFQSREWGITAIQWGSVYCGRFPRL